MIYKYLTLATILIANVSLALSQVTIGNNEAPENGALLQLKNIDGVTDNSVNATKGLGLPRVELTDINNLYPMFTDDGTSGYKIGSTSYTKADEDEKHIGLVVYNTNNCFYNYNGNEQGTYVWDGAKWNALVDNEIQSSDVNTFKDNRDNRVYRYRSFGDAGIWMLDNLAYEPTASDQITLSANPSNDINTMLYCYPSVIETDGTNSYWFDIYPHIGLFYSWRAVTLNQNKSTYDQGQILGNTPGPYEVENLDSSFNGSIVQGSKPNAYIQGICPNGWHVPSDREWNLLEKEISLYPQKYGSYEGTTWDQDWETIKNNTPRPRNAPGHARTMLSMCTPLLEKSSTFGLSFSASNGGLDILLVGFGVNGLTKGYGSGGHYWSSSQDGTGSGIRRYIINGEGYDKEGIAVTYSANYLFSVRCKKN